MYIDSSNKPKKVSASTIRKHMVKRINDWNKNYPRNKIEMSETDLDYVAPQIADLNKAILKGWDVWSQCEKEPRGNLDTGNHYYSIHYLTMKNGKPGKNKLWLYDFIRVIGGYNQNRDRSLDKFVFGSGAIGMSRQLDATDGLFNFLKSCGGAYVQL